VGAFSWLFVLTVPIPIFTGISKDFLQSLQDRLVNYLFAVLGDKYSMNSKGVYAAIAFV